MCVRHREICGTSQFADALSKLTEDPDVILVEDGLSEFARAELVAANPTSVLMTRSQWAAADQDAYLGQRDDA